MQVDAHALVRRLTDDLRRTGPTPAALCDVTQALRDWGRSPEWDCCGFREAAAGEELLVPLAVSDDDGPSLYLVSDGPSSISPPHGHDIWAVIVGIRGVETNHRYALRSAVDRAVAYSSTVDVGPGDGLVLLAHDLHSTEVRHGAPTFHLHLYGRPLHRLPRFEDRCYRVA